MKHVLLLVAACGLAFAADSKLADALEHQDSATIKVLLAQHADPNAAQADGTTALMWAVRQDDLGLVDRLFKAGAHVAGANRYGVSAMSLAAENSNPQMLERLIQAGADVNLPGVEGETPLMTVARGGNVEAARVLLRHGASVNATEEWRGQTALIWAIAQSHPEMAKELIAQGAQVNMRTGKQNWARQITAEPREKWMPQGYLTPLLFAARQGSVDCARVLLDAGADINAQDLEGISPLLLSIINGHYDTAAFLIDRGADVNLADKTGRAPLFSAVDFHSMPFSNRPSPKELDNELTSFDVFTRLLAHGARINAELTAQQPYRAKVDRGNDTMLNAGTTPLLRAAKAGDAVIVKVLLDKGADPKLTQRAGINPLMAAAGLGTREEDGTGRKKTEAEAIETIQLLLSAGLDINAVDTNGRSAVFGAAMWGFDKVVRFLAEHGAQLDTKDKRGLTPLDAALGKAGGVGFDQATGNPHPGTAAVIQELLKGPTAKN